MRTAAAFIAFALLASQAQAEDYMGLAWNQTVKEILSDVDVGDVNGDGRMEVAVSGSSDGLVYLFDYGGNLVWKRDMMSYVNTVRMADLDGDGEDEVVVGHADISIYDGAGNRTGRYNTQKSVFEIDAGDLDGDGRTDIVFSSYDKGECKDSAVYALSGATRKELWRYNIGKDLPFDMAVGDVNGDGRAEVAVGLVYRVKNSNSAMGCTKMYDKPSGILLLSGQGGLLWQYQTGSGVMSIAMGDVDGDGRDEVVAGGYPDIVVVDGDGKLIWQDSTSINTYVEDVIAADLDGDNRSEVAAASNKVDVFSPDGKLMWTGITDSRAYSLAAGDLDGDGRRELVAGSSSVYVFSHDGKELWRSPSHTSYGFVRCVDLDGNGYEEAVAGSVKNVYAFKTLVYAKRLRALNLYRQGVALSSRDRESALEYLRDARDLYRELGMTQELTDCVNLIDTLSDASGQTTAVRDEARGALNESRRLAAEGDVLNAARKASLARTRYSSVQDEVGVADVKELMDLLRPALLSNASYEIILSNESYSGGDLLGALTHAEAAGEYFRLGGDDEGAAKAGELAGTLRDALGVRPDEGPKTTLPDASELMEKVKALSPAILLGLGLFLAFAIMLVVMSLYFWRIGRRKRLDVRRLHVVSYGNGGTVKAEVAKDAPAEAFRPRVPAYQPTPYAMARTEYSAKADTGRVTLTPNRGIFRSKVCRSGVCLKAKPVGRRGLTRFQRSRR